jgi:hypothetical protein
MALVNLTPHVINVGSLAIAPNGAIARVSSSVVKIDEVDGVDVVKTTFGTVEGLPNTQEGVWLIVSALVRLAAPERSDLLSPGEQVRNAAGQVVGCKNLTR